MQHGLRSDWTYEVKLDGYRAIGIRTSGETTLYSRNHKNFNKRLPQIAEALGDLPRPNRRLISNLSLTAAKGKRFQNNLRKIRTEA